MLSIWEKQSFLNYDFIVVGAGITGLSAALSIKELEPSASVLVLERGLLPTGASTKNAGFACIGTIGEKLHDIALMGEENVISLMRKRWEGLQLLRKRVGDANMDYEQYGGYELITDGHESSLQYIDRMNALLQPYFGDEVYKEKKELLSVFGFNGDLVHSLIYNRIDGQLHSGRMVRTLWKLCQERGIMLLTGAEVSDLQEDGDSVKVRVKQADAPMDFSCSRLAVCTNAFTRKLLPDVELQPGRGQVLLTSGIERLPFRGTFNFDEGFYYFRNLGNRILFGGGRNMDFEGESTTDFVLNDRIQQKLEWYLSEMIIPGRAFTISDRWAGIMAFGKEKLPEVRRYSERIMLGVKLNGMGVALGSRIGQELAQLCCSA